MNMEKGIIVIMIKKQRILMLGVKITVVLRLKMEITNRFTIQKLSWMKVIVKIIQNIKMVVLMM